MTLLAAELARATAGRATVCLGCPLGPLHEPSLVALVPPLLGDLPLDLAEVQLVVLGETAETLLQQCAMAGVVEVWVLSAGAQARRDSADQLLERLTLPSAGSYRRRSLVMPGESLSLIALPEVTFTPLGP